MNKQSNFWSIPRLAQRLGITPAALRDHIKRGRLEPPPELPVTGERAYTAAEADRIELWYLRKVANGQTRGPGAKARRQRATERLNDHQQACEPSQEGGSIQP